MFDRAKAARRRAEKLERGGTFSASEFITVCDSNGWRCVYCGIELTRDTLTADHAVPLSRGGSNELANIVPACRSCNSRKHDRTAEEFLAMIGRRGVQD